GIGNNRGGLQMIREVVSNRVAGKVFARDTLAGEEHILRLQNTVEVRFRNDARRHVPVQCPGRTIGLLHAIAVGVVGVGITAGAGDAALLVVGVVLAAGVVGHVAGSVVLVVGAGDSVHPVPHIGGCAHVLGAALGDRLLQQVAPGVIGVAVPPVLG